MPKRTSFLPVLACACAVVACSSSSEPSSGGAPPSSVPSRDAAASDASGTVSPNADAGGAGLSRDWALWPMPNGSGEGLPNPTRYTVVGDVGTHQTVKDDVTGLVWIRGLGGTNLFWEQASDACAGSTHAGFDDWRLPTRIELITLVDFSQPQYPYIDYPTLQIGSFQNHAELDYWTSTLDAGKTRGWVWVVRFMTGQSLVISAGEQHHVACVRGGPQIGTEHYVVRADAEVAGGTVEDVYTKLTWQRQPSPTPETWSNATTRCAGVGEGWRLPSIKELSTLIDPSRVEPAMDVAAFPGESQDEYWSSTKAPAADHAFTMTVRTGHPFSAAKTDTKRVRCVR